MVDRVSKIDKNLNIINKNENNSDLLYHFNLS